MNSTCLEQQKLIEVQEIEVKAKPKLILDACCAHRMMWFDKKHPNALYIDERASVNPDEVQDFRHLPYQDNSFSLIAWDPPHQIRTDENKSIFKERFGYLKRETWPLLLKEGFNELWRVLAPKGVLVLKWSDHDIKCDSLLRLFHTQPLFGQVTAGSRPTKGSDRRHYKTYWFTFMKIPEETLDS